MRKQIKAIFPDENPLSPRIIELEADVEVTDGGLKFKSWVFKAGTPIDDINFFLEFTSDPKCKTQILGFEEN
jgi:hypothetical protein